MLRWSSLKLCQDKLGWYPQLPLPSQAPGLHALRVLAAATVISSVVGPLLQASMPRPPCSTSTTAKEEREHILCSCFPRAAPKAPPGSLSKGGLGEREALSS